MQRTARINLIARNQLTKQSRKAKLRTDKRQWDEWHQVKQQVEQYRRQYTKEERLARREDWVLGPLAPNRDTGLERGVFGTLDRDAVLQNPTVPQSVRDVPKHPGFEARDYGEEGKKGFTGRTIAGNVALQDRVVIVHGPDRLRGLIGRVMMVDDEKEEVRLTGINLGDVRIPPELSQTSMDGKDLKFDTVELPIPMSWIRLTFNLPGESKPSIIRHVHAGPPYSQRKAGSNLPAHTRYATGTEYLTNDGEPYALDWPEEQQEDSLTSTDLDTAAEDKKQGTWKPSYDNHPVCYPLDVEMNITKFDLTDPKTPYTAGLVTNKENASNQERAGISGFTSDDKLAERQRRIASGIMDELRNKYTSKKAFHDDAEWVKRKTMEDARSIWWQGRQILSPQAEAAQRAAAQKRQKIETMIELNQKNTYGLATMVQQLQKTSLSTAPRRPDPKLRKKLDHIGMSKLSNPPVKQTEKPQQRQRQRQPQQQDKEMVRVMEVLQ